MQNDLIMNQIPLPKYFDGTQWNTLRHMYIKQIFKEMGKFNVPNLQFFNNMIKHKHKKANEKRSGSVLNSKQKQLSYNQVKEEFQYALMLMDRGSNVMDELVQKAQKVQQSKSNGKKGNGKTFRSRSVNHNSKSFVKENNKGKYFDHTVDLVFRNRRNTYLDSLKKPKEYEEMPEVFEKRFKDLGLVDIANPNL